MQARPLGGLHRTGGPSRCRPGLCPAADQRLFGRKLTVKDNADAARRKLRCLAKDPTVAVPTGSDEPTSAGATLIVTNPGTNETATVPLPMGSWTKLTSGDFFD